MLAGFMILLGWTSLGETQEPAPAPPPPLPAGEDAAPPPQVPAGDSAPGATAATPASDDIPVDAFPSAQAFTNVLSLANDRGRQLLADGLAKEEIKKQLETDVADFIAELDLAQVVDGKPKLSEPQGKALTAIVNQVVSALPGSKPASTKSDVKPTDRYKKRDLNIRFYAIQEAGALKKDEKLSEADRRREVVQRVSTFAAEVTDVSDPSPAEKAYLEGVADDALASRRPASVDQGFGLSLGKQQDFLIKVAGVGQGLERTVSPASDDFATKLLPLARAEFRKLADLAPSASLTNAQERFVGSVVRQVQRSIRNNPTSPDSKVASGLAPDVRKALVAFLRQANKVLAGRNISLESRKLTLLASLRDQGPSIIGILRTLVSGFSDSDQFRSQLADPSVAESLVDEALRDSDVAGTGAGTGTTTTTTTTTGIIVTTPTTTTAPGVLLVPVSHRHDLRRLFQFGRLR